MTPTIADETYLAALATWRAEAEATIRAPEGWLSVAGLFWLADGEHTMGSDPACAVALPAGSAPAVAARLSVRDGTLTIAEAAPGLLVNGKPPPDRPLRAPADGAPDRVTVGRLVLQVHRSGGRVGLRVRDPDHPDRAAFTGRRWYPPRPEYRVTARFEPYDPPRPISIVNLLGDSEAQIATGALAFSLDGHDLRLEIWGNDPSVQLVFRDATSGVETYGAARFLYTWLAPDGTAELDFNKAVCPPCAFTPFATCPLPPPQNRLAIPIRAGELDPGWLGH